MCSLCEFRFELVLGLVDPFLVDVFFPQHFEFGHVKLLVCACVCADPCNRFCDLVVIQAFFVFQILFNLVGVHLSIVVPVDVAELHELPVRVRSWPMVFQHCQTVELVVRECARPKRRGLEADHLEQEVLGALVEFAFIFCRTQNGVHFRRVEFAVLVGVNHLEKLLAASLLLLLVIFVLLGLQSFDQQYEFVEVEFVVFSAQLSGLIHD